MSNLIPFPGTWKGAGRAPNGARCCAEARAVACGNCSSHWICSWHGDRHSPEFIEPIRSPPSTEAPPRAPSQPNAPGFHLGPDECLACGKFDDCVCEECPSCDGTGDAVPGKNTCGPCSDCKGAGRIP